MGTRWSVITFPNHALHLTGKSRRLNSVPRPAGELVVMAIIVVIFGVGCLVKGEIKISNRTTLRGGALRRAGITIVFGGILTGVSSYLMLPFVEDYLWVIFVPFAPALAAFAIALIWAIRTGATSGAETAIRQKASIRLLFILSNLVLLFIIVAVITLIAGLFPLFERRAPSAGQVIASIAGACLLSFSVWLSLWAKRNKRE